MKRYLAVVAVTMLLSGCELVEDVFEPTPTPPVVQPKPPVQPEKPPVTPPEEPPVFVEPPPQITYTIDWQSAVQPLVTSLRSKVTTGENRLLLIDNIKNNTKSYVASQPLYDLVTRQLANSGQFTLLSRQQIVQGRRALGLPSDDTLTTKSKVLGLARHLAANYILLTTLSGDNQQPQVNMQLLLVNSGEIVWSGQAATTKKQVE